MIDEINRSPAKTQAALFEVMEERQITMDGTLYKMEQPFLVVATQNPIEHEGTYRLPEAQLDRFLFKINVDYPNLSQEMEIVKNHHENRLDDKISQVQAVISGHQLKNFQNLVKEIIVEKLGVKESEVTPEANFTNDLGADSLDTVEMIMEFETKFDIKIADDQAEKITTVGEAIAHIEKAIAEK